MRITFEGWRYMSRLMVMILGLDLATVSIMACLSEWGTCVLEGYLWEDGSAGWTYNLWSMSGGEAPYFYAQLKEVVRERLREPCKRGSGYYALTYEMEGSFLTGKLTQIMEVVCEVRSKVKNYREAPCKLGYKTLHTSFNWF
jgi:hypothetical protein